MSKDALAFMTENTEESVKEEKPTRIGRGVKMVEMFTKPTKFNGKNMAPDSTFLKTGELKGIAPETICRILAFNRKTGLYDAFLQANLSKKEAKAIEDDLFSGLSPEQEETLLAFAKKLADQLKKSGKKNK